MSWQALRCAQVLVAVEGHELQLAGHQHPRLPEGFMAPLHPERYYGTNGPRQMTVKLDITG